MITLTLHGFTLWNLNMILLIFFFNINLFFIHDYPLIIGLALLIQRPISSIGCLPILGGLSLFEILHGKSRLYINFHPLGYKVYPCLRDYVANKFSRHGISCIFLGWSSSYKGLRCSDPLTSKIYVTHQAKFDQLNFPLIPNSTAQPPASLFIQF